MRRILLVLIIVLIALSVGLVGCADDSQEDAPATETEEPAPGTETEETTDADPDRALVETKCSLCHTTDRVWGADYDRETWEATLDRMKANGMVISDEEYEQIVAYLSEL